jgi:hypothetical protein
MDAVAALDALGLVDLAETGLFVHGDRPDRAGLLAGTNLVNNDLVGAVLGAHAALPAFLGIDMGADPAVIAYDRNSAEAARLITGMAKAAMTVICNRIGRDRTVVTGCGNHLNYVGRVRLSGAQATGQTDPLADDFAFAVDAAPELRKRSRDDLLRKELLLALQLPVPCESSYFTKNSLGDIAGSSVVCNHSFSLFCPAMLSVSQPADSYYVNDL